MALFQSRACARCVGMFDASIVFTFATESPEMPSRDHLSIQSLSIGGRCSHRMIGDCF